MVQKWALTLLANGAAMVLSENGRMRLRWTKKRGLISILSGASWGSERPEQGCRKLMSIVAEKLRRLASLVRFSHTVFALPFALASVALAWPTHPITLYSL